MKMYRCLILSLAIGAATAGLLNPAAVAKDVIAGDVRALAKTDREIADPSKKIPLLRKMLGRTVAKIERVGLDRISDNDAKDFFKAASTISFYSNEGSDVVLMKRAFDQMSKRQLVSKRQREDMLAHYIAARMLAEAAGFAKEPANSDLKMPPEFLDLSSGGGDKTTLWRLSETGSKLSRVDYSEGARTQVVVVSAPWCHFSQEAANAIAGDPELLRLMAAHSTWIIPQSIIHDFDDVEEWNGAHPGLPMALVYQSSEWPAISSWATPGFYFFNHGILISTVTGWPGPEQLEKIREGLHRIDLR